MDMLIIYNEKEYDCDVHSFKDYTGLPFVDIKNGEVVYASNFSQEIPDSVIFPVNMQGVTFIKCNLMNVSVPKGNEVIDCQTTRFKVQNDLRDWKLNDKDEPESLINEKYWQMKEVSIDPADIPAEKIVLPKDKDLVDYLKEIL